MDIDQLLEKHPAPWNPAVWFPCKMPDGRTVFRHLIDADGMRIDESEYAGTHITADAWSVTSINAYAALKAENAALRKCVQAADDSCREGEYGDAARILDAARKELP